MTKPILVLTRTFFRPDGIFGILRYKDGSVIARTLEHAYQTEGGGQYLPKVPYGAYTCRLIFSNHFKRNVYQLLSVPGCSYIEIHCGNFNADSEGCILLGDEIAEHGSEEMLTNSKATLDKFMEAMTGIYEFQLMVV